MRANLVCIKTYTTRSAAELARNLLSDHHIPVILSIEDVGGYSDALLNATGGARVLVRKTDATRALELLRAMD